MYLIDFLEGNNHEVADYRLEDIQEGIDVGKDSYTADFDCFSFKFIDTVFRIYLLSY